MGNPFLLALPGIISSSLYVSAFRGREAINRPYRFSIELLSQEPIAPDDLLGERATLTVATSARHRFVPGVISACDLGARQRDGRWAATLRIEPRLATMRWTSGCRIFHDQSVIEIAARVLSEHEVTYTLRLARLSSFV